MPIARPRKASRAPAATRGGNQAMATDLTAETRRIGELKARKPKQPMSAYLCFCKKKREKLHRKHPDLSPNAVTVKLGKWWQSKGEEARTKYVKLHEESVSRYKEELERFHLENPDAKDLLAKEKKKKRKAPLRSVAKQPAPLPLALVSPVSVAMVTEPSSQETMGGDEVEAAEKEEVGGGEEGEEEELNEVLVADGKQNGTVTVEESGTETDSSESSVTD